MNESEGATQRLVLSDDPSLGTIEVDLQAFFEFSFWIAEELQDLIEQRRILLPPRRPHSAAQDLWQAARRGLKE